MRQTTMCTSEARPSRRERPSLVFVSVLAPTSLLEALAGVLVERPAGERQNHGRWQIISKVGVKLDIHDDGLMSNAIQAATALAAAEHTSADTEWLGAGGIMYEAATLHCTDHEIARATRDGPRLGWQRHLAALPRS